MTMTIRNSSLPSFGPRGGITMMGNLHLVAGNSHLWIRFDKPASTSNVDHLEMVKEFLAKVTPLFEDKMIGERKD